MFEWRHYFFPLNTICDLLTWYFPICESDWSPTHGYWTKPWMRLSRIQYTLYPPCCWTPKSCRQHWISHMHHQLGIFDLSFHSYTSWLWVQLICNPIEKRTHLLSTLMSSQTTVLTSLRIYLPPPPSLNQTQVPQNPSNVDASQLIRHHQL